MKTGGKAETLANDRRCRHKLAGAESAIANAARELRDPERGVESSLDAQALEVQTCTLEPSMR